MNNCVFIGRLTRDPELRYTKDNKAVCKFSIAVDREYKNNTADYPNITVFGNTAENCARYLAKGRLVCVLGRYQQETYEKNGEKKKAHGFICDRVEFLELGGKNENNVTQGDFNGTYEQANQPSQTWQQAEQNVQQQLGVPVRWEDVQNDGIPF